MFIALGYGAFNLHLSKLHLGAEIPLETLLADPFLAAGKRFDGLVLQTHPAAHHDFVSAVPQAADQEGGKFQLQAGRTEGQLPIDPG